MFPQAPESFDEYVLLDVHREIRAFLEKNNIRYVDLYDAFAGSGELPVEYAGDPWHPNARGHRFIGRQLAATIPLD